MVDGGEDGIDEAALLGVIRNSRRGPMKPKAVARALDLPTQKYRALKARLAELAQSGRLYRVKGGRYAVPERISLVTGRVSLIRRGDGFVRSEESGDEVFVPQRDLDSALDGDRVVVRVESHPPGRKPVGRVIRILTRERDAIVAVFHEGRRAAFAVPRDPRVKNDLVIPPGDEGEAVEGDVVRVRITGYGPRGRGPVGEVIEVLGRLGDPGVDVLSVVHEHGLPAVFPPGIESEARRIVESGGRPAPMEGREDLRALRALTIDPASAKDHDDALSLERLDGGRTRVGIHIADVSWYVRPDSLLDREARARGTSVYLVDRVVPMLPHTLSSDLCSLLPGEDRFTISLFVEVDRNGTVESHRFTRSLIRSRHRLAYEDVQAVLDEEGSVDADTDLDLRDLARVARTLRTARTARGALDFDLPESRVHLDDEGRPISIEVVQRLEAHEIVEDFMLLANEIVAGAGEARGLPVLYRVHEAPTSERSGQLAELLARFGYTLPSRSRVDAKALRRVLDAVAGRPEERLVSTMVLRSMQRARYSAENLGHFGLALETYAHFTSPIRRYPDLVTHRAIVRTLIDGERPDAGAFEELDDVAAHASLREEIATSAERDSVEMKKIEFMEEHLGDLFDGTISGVKAFGAFVQLDEILVDGLVHVSALDDDYYEFREADYALVGRRSGRQIRLGDRVRVRVARVDREERHLDFVLIASGNEVV
ncbi:MAG: ribonuclease R [Longimicrobiales bacterium]|nr:ribonuclease R [Longimicrobiales bacterium]